MSVDGYDGLGLAYRYNGQLDKSIAAYRKLLSLAPDAGWERTALGNVLLQKGDADAALAEFQKEPDRGVPPGRSCDGIPGARPQSRVGRRVLAELHPKKYPDTKPFSLASVLAYRGDYRWGLRDAGQGRPTCMTSTLGAIAIFPTFAPLHKDPRWLPLLRRMGLAPEQLAAIKFDISVPKQ